MKILFICASNKDRSPALEAHFRSKCPQHEYKSAGVNKYFTGKNKTHYLTAADIEWANLLVFAQDAHYWAAFNAFMETNLLTKECEILNIQEFSSEATMEPYLLEAEDTLKIYLEREL